MSNSFNDPLYEFKKLLRDILPKSIELPDYKREPESGILNTPAIKDNFAKFTPTIPRSAYLAALISQQAYNSVNNRAPTIDVHYHYIKSISNDRICVYVHEFLTSQCYIGIRGTRVTDLEDIRADIAIVAGKEFNDPLTINTIKDVKAILTYLSVNFDIGQDTTTITGHSLGSLLSVYASYNTECKCDCFNIGISPSQSLNQNVFNNPNITSYIMEGDPIAGSSGLVIKNTVVLKPKPMPNNPLQAHSLAFLLKAVKPDFPIRS